ncbi:MAG: hypothetical protein H6741_31545 [Alphaproteobacteria bacterium]|nr:hypothetical protein [Alphaproteobacteria bacterium]
MILLALLSCGALPEPVSAVPAPVPLEAPRLARRISLDLRGVLPSEEELDAVEADPSLLPSLAEQWMQDPRFEERLVHLLALRWRTRVDVFDIEAFDYQLPEDQEYRFERAVGEEPLRLMARIAAEDRPWTDIVTTDHTLATPLLLDIWPLEALEEGETWVSARYTDGRPAAGVLATNGLWWRYTTTDSNMNRTRAAAISRLLLCEDFMARPVSFAGDDRRVEGDAEVAVREDPYCLACHAAIDPMSAALFGFWWPFLYSVAEETRYHPEREPLGEEVLGTPPAWFGEPMAGLADLGVHVANDPRFLTCAVESFAESLWQRPARLEDQDSLEALRADFVEDGWRVKALLAGILETEAYTAGDSWDAAEAVGPRMLRPDQLDSALTALSGYEWSAQGYRLLDDDTVGFRVLAGGADGLTVLSPASQPGLTHALVLQRAAQTHAAVITSRQLNNAPQPQSVFSHVRRESRPGDEAFVEELRSLHWRLYAERPSEEWLENITALWAAVYAQGAEEEAWASVLSVMLRDTRFMTY